MHSVMIILRYNWCWTSLIIIVVVVVVVVFYFYFIFNLLLRIFLTCKFQLLNPILYSEIYKQNINNTMTLWESHLIQPTAFNQIEPCLWSSSKKRTVSLKKRKTKEGTLTSSTRKHSWDHQLCISLRKRLKWEIWTCTQ